MVRKSVNDSTRNPQIKRGRRGYAMRHTKTILGLRKTLGRKKGKRGLLSEKGGGQVSENWTDVIKKTPKQQR